MNKYTPVTNYNFVIAYYFKYFYRITVYFRNKDAILLGMQQDFQIAEATPISQCTLQQYLFICKKQ